MIKRWLYQLLYWWLDLSGKDRAEIILGVAGIAVVLAYTIQARTTNQLMRRAQRPYIWLTNGGLGSPRFISEGNSSGLGQIVWDWHFMNYGQSPGYDVTYRHFIKLGDHPFRLSFGEKGDNIGAPLPPTKDDFVTVVSPPIAPQEFERLMSLDGGIAIRAILSYTDGDGVEHETKVRLDHLASGAITESEAEIK